MIGTILNAAGILIGGLIGLVKKNPLSAARQNYLKIALGAFTVYYGLRLTWLSLNGPFRHIVRQLAIVVIALALGKLAGRLLRLQNTSNRVGQFARQRIQAAKPDNPNRFSDGFNACAALFCAAPLGILGAVANGLPVHGAFSEYFYPLAVKAVMDGLAAMSFVAIFGWGVLLSAVPVLVFQGAITVLCARLLGPFLQTHSGVGSALVDSMNATVGLLIFCVALLIFELKKIEVTNYLPSLAVAPLLTWLLR